MPKAGLIEEYRINGYAIARGLLDREYVTRLVEEADRLYQTGIRYRTTTDTETVRWLVVDGPSQPPVLRGAQNVASISPLFDSLRVSPAILNLLKPFIGPNLVSIVNTLFWKEPGEVNTRIAFHQDAMFRKPEESFRNLGSSYVQLGIALDPHGPENGGLKIVAASHRGGDHKVMRDQSVMVSSCDDGDLSEYGYERDQLLNIELSPGDAILWHPHLVHGSPANRSKTMNRRFVVTGYMRMSDTDVGVPAFDNSHPVPWG